MITAASGFVLVAVIFALYYFGILEVMLQYCSSGAEIGMVMLMDVAGRLSTATVQLAGDVQAVVEAGVSQLSSLVSPSYTDTNTEQAEVETVSEEVGSGAERDEL